jgi:hypothetical protein
VIGGLDAPDQGVCSRADCREVATWRIDWRNPRIHTGDRRKTWLACDEHRASLADFLAARQFLRDVERLDQAAGADTGSPGD